MKYYLDPAAWVLPGEFNAMKNPAAWVLPGEFNAMKNCVLCKGKLTTMSGEINVRFIALLRPFEQTKSPFLEEKSVKSPEISAQSSSGVDAFSRD